MQFPFPKHHLDQKATWKTEFGLQKAQNLLTFPKARSGKPAVGNLSTPSHHFLECEDPA